MHDGERYPIAVKAGDPPGPSFSDAPEVAPTQVLDHYGNDKLPVEGVYKSDGPLIENNPRAICGLKRRTFFIVLAVAVVVVIGAIVGGIVGGLAASGQLASSNDDSSSSSLSTEPSPTTSSLPPQGTGPTDRADRAVAASLSTDSENSDVQIFYQDLKTSNIFYRRVVNDDANDEQTVNLDIEPAWGTPLSSATINGSDPLIAQLFYLTLDEKTQIAQATLECELLDTSCQTTSNSIISANISNTIHEDSQLASLRLGDDLIRVYYQSDDEQLWALNGDDTKKGWSSHRIAEAAYAGTGIVAVGANDDAIRFFFVANETEQLNLMIYSDVLGPNDNSGKEVSGSPGSAWAPDASLAGVYVPDSDPYRLYYAQPDNGTIVSYWQPPPEGDDPDEFAFNRNQNDRWGKVQGGLASVAWADQVRLYYFQGKKLVMSAQDVATWAEAEPL